MSRIFTDFLRNVLDVAISHLQNILFSSFITWIVYLCQCKYISRLHIPLGHFVVIVLHLESQALSQVGSCAHTWLLEDWCLLCCPAELLYSRWWYLVGSSIRWSCSNIQCHFPGADHPGSYGRRKAWLCPQEYRAQSRSRPPERCHSHPAFRKVNVCDLKSSVH